VFEPGFSTKGGTGLGLAIVRDIVAEAGGSVSADSTVGQGTTVTVRWPLHHPSWSGLTRPTQANGARDGRVRSDHDDGGKTVLLVEDEPMMRQLAERALRRAGWHVIATASAATALAAATTTRPDAVVADLTLPGNMDGIALIAALRENWPNLPAILVSGYADSAASADPGGQTVMFLAKPYTLVALEAALRASVRD
jgi:two-component system cell cycle sensor histidine kinase/response regulator CckA